jgi:hypothetical protein
MYIGNLAPDVSDTELRAAVGQYGTVLDVKVYRKGGYAFAQFASHEEAVAAIVGLSGQNLGGKTLKCSWGRCAALRQLCVVWVCGCAGDATRACLPACSCGMQACAHGCKHALRRHQARRLPLQQPPGMQGFDYLALQQQQQAAALQQQQLSLQQQLAMQQQLYGPPGQLPGGYGGLGGPLGLPGMPGPQLGGGPGGLGQQQQQQQLTAAQQQQLMGGAGQPYMGPGGQQQQPPQQGQQQQQLDFSGLYYPGGMYYQQ